MRSLGLVQAKLLVGDRVTVVVDGCEIVEGMYFANCANGWVSMYAACALHFAPMVGARGVAAANISKVFPDCCAPHRRPTPTDPLS